MSEAPLLRVEGLAKAYGGPPVLRRVDLELRAGEGVVLLGPNGAGKSTLLRVLAGLHRPQRGRIFLQGRPFHPGDPEHRRAVGFVSHESFLYAGLSARENLRFTADLHGLPGRESLCERALGEVGLDWVGERPVRTFSRGMVQRLSLARSLLHGPRLLLLDEPMSGLDPEGIRRLEERLVSLREAGAGILMASHDLAHVAPVGTRTVFLVRGKLVEPGEVDPTSRPTLEERYREIFGERGARAPGVRR
jgi:heme exporter protein A